MANQTSALPIKKRRELKKSQAIVVMIIGAILFAQAFFISAEPGSSAHFTKNIVALIGIVVLLVGVALRPVKAAPEGK
jgi:predicted Na+-dependent transporter